MTASYTPSKADADAAVSELTRAIKAWWSLSSEARRAPAQPPPFPSLIHDLMNALSIDAKELARLLEVDVATPKRWLDPADPTPPRPSILPQLEVIVDQVMAARGHVDPAIVGAPSLGSESIADHINDASDLWILKWGRRFVSASDQHLIDALTAVMKRKAENKDYHGPFYHYVYPSPDLTLPSEDGKPPEPIDQTAYDSFLEFQYSLRDRLRREEGLREITPQMITEVVHDHPIMKLSQVLRLGLPQLNIGFFMIDYLPDKQRELGRRSDIFVELDAPVLAADMDPLKGEPGQFKTHWVRLDPRVAESMRSRWWPVLVDLCPKLRASGGLGNLNPNSATRMAAAESIAAE